MSKLKLSREEQETVILGNAASKEWEITTADPRMIRALEKRGYKRDQRPNPWGYISYTLPFNRLKIGKREKSKRGFAAKKAVAPHTNAVSGDQNSTAMVL